MATIINVNLSDACNAIYEEVIRAKEKWPGDFHNYHEAYAVIAEEVDELWDEVKKSKHDYQKLYDEAKQVAAMCLRLMTELPKQK